MENKLRNCTLVFLVKKKEGKITDICLAMKKRGFGANRWNGVGGKTEQGETIENATIREAKEEIDVLLKKINKVAELTFNFPYNPAWDQLVHVYLTENWSGEPRETEEMNPKWHSIDEIPYDNMWPDDIFWLPEVINGKLLKARFKFAENDIIIDKQIDITNEL